MSESQTGPTAVVLMGISGSGKSTIGRALAEASGGRFHDADDFHPASNVAKMKAGIPLTDEDRAGWLETLRDLLKGECAVQQNLPVILACSALKEKYRDVLKSGAPDLRFVFLQGSRELISERMRARIDHFMPDSLIDSQLDALEAPLDAIVVDIAAPVSEIVEEIQEVLGWESNG